MEAGKIAVVGYEYGTLATGNCLFFNFAVVFSSAYFHFRQVQTKINLAISMSIGEADLSSPKLLRPDLSRPDFL
jgi:hypothetical protein